MGSRVPVPDETRNILDHHVIGNKADAAVQAVASTKSIIGYLKGILDAVMGSAGLVTWPAAAAPADGVSLAEAIRFIADAQSGTAGLATFPAAAAPANDVSMAEALRAVFNLVAPIVVTGEADIDIDSADYTSYQNLVTVVPAAGAPLRNAKIVFDLAKSSTGFAAGHTTETLQLAVSRKVDGTNWRRDEQNASTAVSGTAAAGEMVTLELGIVGVSEEIRVEAILSAENAVDAELPFALYYEAISAPTVTPVAAA